MVILRLVQPHDMLHSEVLEGLDVIFWSGFQLVAWFSYSPGWTHECHESSWDDPIHISILHSFEILIFKMIKSLEIIPSKTCSDLQSLDTLERLEVIGTRTH